MMTSPQFHPKLHADIAGWGSTVEAGPKPYKYVPVNITRPGNPKSVSGFMFFNTYATKRC